MDENKKKIDNDNVNFDVNKKSNRKRIRNSVVACVCVTALGVAGISAYFTDSKTANNTFTVGNVKQQLLEPSWNEDNAKDLTPGDVVAKDPQIKNTGSNDQYVFMVVDESYYESIEPKSITNENIGHEKRKTDAYKRNLFDYTINDGWSYLGTNDFGMDFYYYGKNNTLTKLSKNETTPALFNNVTILDKPRDIINDNEYLYWVWKDYNSDEASIYIASFGIQADNLAIDGEVTPEKVFNILATQKGSPDKIGEDSQKSVVD